GVEVIAVDADPEAPGFGAASVAEVVDFSDVERVLDVARRRRVDGVLTVASDRAVTVVAAGGEKPGLPGIGTATAHGLTNKVAMRRRLAAFGVPQPRFVAVRALEDLDALGDLRFPVVIKAADSGGQRGLQKLASADLLARALPRSLSFSSGGEAIVEEFH